MMNSENFIDYYTTLELDFKATKKEVRDKYKKLALQFHPDKNTNPSAEEYFKEIKEAYETLYDDKKREAYDILYVKVLNYRAKMSAQARETKTDIGISKEVIEKVALLAGGVIAGIVIFYGLKFLFEDNSKEKNKDDNEDGTANATNDKYKCKINTSSIPKPSTV